MIVEPLSDEQEWERFVASSPQGTFYHTLRWKRVLEKSFAFEPLYLVIRDSNRDLLGVCPFVIRKELKVIKVLDSLWESDYAGPLVKDGYAEPAMSALMDYLKQLAHKKGITYAKIRFSDEELSQHFSYTHSRTETLTGVMALDLGQKPTDYIWGKVFTTKGEQRTYIRRFEKDGFQNREAESIEDLNTFYTLYRNNMSYIGGLSFPFSFFKQAWDALYPDYFNILLTANDEKCIGAEAFFIYKPNRSICQTCIGLDRNVPTRYHTYIYLSWGLIKWAEKNGYRYVSLGSTPSDPSDVHYSHKAKFGAEFDQDYVVYLPFNRTAFLVREMMENLWRKTRTRLPKQVARKLEDTAEGQ